MLCVRQMQRSNNDSPLVPIEAELNDYLTGSS